MSNRFPVVFKFGTLTLFPSGAYLRPASSTTSYFLQNRKVYEEKNFAAMQEKVSYTL
ncbi:MAG: hypothetical protein LBS79_04940 [Tannerella sp.]|nr:hypothetical protein [Tannerella sp.]